MPCYINAWVCDRITSPCYINASLCYINASPCDRIASPCYINASSCDRIASACYINAWTCDRIASPCYINASPCIYKQMLQQGKTPAEAIRAAQKTLRESSDWRSPYYWAGLTVQGEGGRNR